MLNSTRRAIRGLAAGLCFALMTALAAPAPAAEKAELARDGEALRRVVVAPTASESTREAAESLAEYLGRITGAGFEVGEGDGAEGIAVGTLKDFPNLKLDGVLTAEGLPRREQYVLRSHPAGVYVVAADERGVGHAAWDLLHRVGYRQFFPGRNWEVIPREPALSVSVDDVETPDFSSRRIWWSYGLWEENKEQYGAWVRKNRMAPAFNLNTGHAYGDIIAKNKAAFDAHPEFYPLIKGERRPNPQAKLCIGNPELRELVVAYAIKRFEQSPGLESVSMDPSDGGNWCECDRCAALGTVSDRALTLANEVAEAIVARFGPDKYVGMYAYNEHSPPPTKVRVHPNVIISCATAFLKGQGFDAIVTGWNAMGAEQFGVREYYSIIHWDHDLPRQAKAGRPRKLAETIVKQHGMGARFLSAESSENFGPNGLGYYVASRVMWDTDEAQNVDAIYDDFLAKAFGSAEAPMREYYELLTGDNAPQLSEHLLAKMYRALDAAMSKTSDEGVKARIGDLALYTRYLELYLAYSSSGGAQRQDLFEQTIRHVYRMRDNAMTHSLAIYRTKFRDKAIKMPAEAEWKVPAAKNPWKTGGPFTASEVAQIVQAGVANNQPLSFEPASFSMDLVKPDGLSLQDHPGAKGDAEITSRGARSYHTWIDKAPTTIKLRVTNGLIAHYRDRGDAKVTLTPADEAEGKPVADAAVPPDGQPRDLELRTEYTGLHDLRITDGMDSSSVVYERGLPMTTTLSFGTRYESGRQLYVFYVPRGTKVIGGYAQGVRGSLKDPRGEEAFAFPRKAGYFELPVPEGADGKLWLFDGELGKATFMLMTVPPQLARNANELLLPREVVEKDKR